MEYDEEEDIMEWEERPISVGVGYLIPEHKPLGRRGILVAVYERHMAGQCALPECHRGYGENSIVYTRDHHYFFCSLECDQRNERKRKEQGA